MSTNSIDENLLSPDKRRQRNRDEVSTAILNAAQASMREGGSVDLNLNEVARRIGMTTPALYSYYENKAAIYDALFQRGIELARGLDAAAWEEYEPGWEQLRAWYQARLDFALTYPELYRLVFSAPVPGFTPSSESVRASQLQLHATVEELQRLINSGVVNIDIPIGRAVDLLLAMRHGIVVERIGKANVVPAGSGRFEHLIEDTIAMIRDAWSVKKPGQDL